RRYVLSSSALGSFTASGTGSASSTSTCSCASCSTPSSARASAKHNAHVLLLRIVVKVWHHGVGKAAARLAADIEQPKCRIEAHRRPVMGAPRTRRDVRGFALGVPGLWVDNGSASRFVQAQRPVHFGERRRRNKLAVGPVDCIQETVLVRLQDHLALYPLD